ncbi:MAG: hypothetical protein AMXMBFR36_25570 [Acidobacteriota bacterium]
MTRRLLAVIVLRILGIVLLTRALASAIQVVTTYAMIRSRQYGEEFDFALGQWASLAYLGIVGSFGLAFLVHTGRVAGWMFPEFDDREVAFSGSGLGTLAFRVLGAASVIYALPGLVVALVEIVWGLGAERRLEFLTSLPGRWADDLYWFLAFVVGAVVYRNAERLARVRPTAAPGAPAD